MKFRIVAQFIVTSAVAFSILAMTCNPSLAEEKITYGATLLSVEAVGAALTLTVKSVGNSNCQSDQQSSVPEDRAVVNVATAVACAG